MDKIQKSSIILLAASLLFAVFFWGQQSTAQEKTMADDDIYQRIQQSFDFKNSHSVMARQKKRFNAILEGFLTGNTESIISGSDEILDDMNTIVRTYIPPKETDPLIWNSVAKIIEETHLIKESVAGQDHNKAYGHFTSAMASCIQCHQQLRAWGKLNPPAQESEKEEQPLLFKEKK